MLRAVTYAALFVGLVLVFVPAQVLSWSGITRPAAPGAPQVAGMIVGAAGAALALLFLLVTHLFVVWHEEPTLQRTFGEEYEAYCRRVRRWWPRR